MSADKYPSIIPCQMDAIDYLFPNLQNYAPCEKDFKDTKHNSLHLGQKCARISVLGHYLFLKAHSFPRATLSEICSLYIFAPNGGHCFTVYIICLICIFKRVWLGGEIELKFAKNYGWILIKIAYLNFSGQVLSHSRKQFLFNFNSIKFFVVWLYFSLHTNGNRVMSCNHRARELGILWSPRVHCKAL